ncbi:MAG: LysM peptidoglycan-binding domain-containing protein [Acidobacteria bacterium]|nr:LysM peptidoglycan-binding domain-containing protein [Acidobacteriota bacterium]
MTQLLSNADRHFETGRHELAVGHLDRAKAEFNRSLALLLESPQGARADARVREHFDRLVDRISALELGALATGDGFTEQRHEPASIDRLLTEPTFAVPEPTAATTETVQADLQITTHDIPIPLNERVLRYVELFQGNLREFLSEGLARGTQYLPMIQDVFRAEGLPLDLAYVPLIESAFKPTALSKAKAKGVWQFMQGTGIENGLKHDWYIDERSDTRKATAAAAKYLKTLYRTFEDWHLALASYNGGPGRVQRALRKSGRNEFWSLSATPRYLPRETREYVPMILAATIIAKNPVQYGFHITPSPVVEPETVSVPAGVDLRRIAEWAGVTADDVQRLNPELRRWTTPLRAATYDVKVPRGTAVLVRASLENTNPTALNALQWYTVRRGESLASIARALRVSRTDLAEANYVKPTTRVQMGQRLVIPRMPSAALLARATAERATGDAVAAVNESDRSEEAEATRVTYRVRRGDTLSSIARKHGTTIDRLKAWNKLRGSTIAVGSRLIILSGREANNQP